VRRAVASVGDVPFGSFGLAEDGRALNPLINSGALVVCELLSRTHSEEDVGRWCRSVGGPRDAGTAASQRTSCFDTAAVAATAAACGGRSVLDRARRGL